MTNDLRNKLIVGGIMLLASFALSTSRTHAATLNVVAGSDGVTTNGQCQLSEAIHNINDQAQTYSDCLAGDGSNDTIELASGVITLTQNLLIILDR